MPDHMPYTNEKSAAFQVVEDYLNEDRQQALDALWALLDGKKIHELEPLKSTTLNVAPPPNNTPSGRKEHVRKDWFGDYRSGRTWKKQEPFDKTKNPTTGFWEYWYGDSEGVFRETFIRAISVALGVPREDPADTKKNKGKPRPAHLAVKQHWPISIFWKCPSPWFEGWIEFKKAGSGIRGGHVSVILTTPAHGTKLYNAPQRPPAAQSADYQEDPRHPSGPNGMWVVSQSFHKKWNPTPGSAPSTSTNWAVPTLGTYICSVGPVVVVAPAIKDGGAAVNGIEYVP